MWGKIFVSLLVIAFCTGLGYLAAMRYRSRKKFFTRLLDFHEKFLNELGYARRPLSAFLKEQPQEGEFGKFLEAAIQRASYSSEFLTKEENAQLSTYLSMLGKGDALSQRGYFASQTSAIETWKNASEKEAKERGDLYLKLGILAGLAFVILIV